MTDLTLNVTGLTIQASEDGTPDGQRTLIGQAVPWNTVARVSSGQLVKFEPGSLNLAAMPVVRDHDATKPVGVVRDAQDTDAGHQVAVKLSTTPLGDESLTLAADGVLTGFSVGASADEYTWDLDDPDDPVMVVSSATARELSLLINPAYGSQSQITKVAAATPHPMKDEESDMNDTTATVAAVAVDAAADDQGPIDITPQVKVKQEAPLTAATYAVEAILAQRGDRVAQSLIQAALTSQISDDNPGIIPPQYVAGILGGYMPYRPVYASLAHGTLPAAGTTLVRPKWASLPKVAKYGTENTQPPTGAVNIGSIQVDKESWAHAVLVGINLINRSDPGYANEYFQAASRSFYVEHEADLAAVISAAAPAPGDTHDNALNVIATAVQNSVVAQTVSGVFTGYWPEWAPVGMNVWGALVGASQFSGPAYGSGSANIDTPQGTVSGITVRATPSIDPDLCIAGHSAVATAYTSAEQSLRALVVNTMSVELGFYTDTAVMVNNPGILGTAEYAPAAGAARISKGK